MNETVDDTIEVGEATLARVGMTSVLRGEMPKVGIGLQKEILATDKRIDKLAREFVDDELSGKFSVPRPFVYRKLFDRLTRPISEAEMTVISSKFPPEATDLALSFKSTLTAAYDHLAEMLPVSEIDTYLGPQNIMPTSDKMRDFWLQYWVIDDPFVCFKLMSRGAMLPEQVETVKQFYPSLYNYMKVSTLNALAEKKIREPKFLALPPRSDRGLAFFKQMRVVEFGINNHVVPPNDPKPIDPKPANVNKGLQSLQTKGQMVEAAT